MNGICQEVTFLWNLFGDDEDSDDSDTENTLGKNQVTKIFLEMIAKMQ